MPGRSSKSSLADIFLMMVFVLALIGCTNQDTAVPRAAKELSREQPEKTAMVAPDRHLWPPGMVFIPGGSFTMGSNDDTADDFEKPAFETSVGSFYMDTTEVTQRDFEALMGFNASEEIGPYLPVMCKWAEAIFYCNERSKREGLDTVYSYAHVLLDTLSSRLGDTSITFDTLFTNYDADGYRLPDEKEFEYACMGGTDKRRYFEAEDIDQYEWYHGNSDGSLKPVASLKPNQFGLYDMCSNIWEYCNDLCSSYCSKVFHEGGRVPLTFEGLLESLAARPLSRGGDAGWDRSIASCKSRHCHTPYFRSSGFRCVRRVTFDGEE